MMSSALYKWVPILHLCLAFGGLAVIEGSNETGPGGGGDGRNGSDLAVTPDASDVAVSAADVSDVASHGASVPVGEPEGENNGAVDRSTYCAYVDKNGSGNRVGTVSFVDSMGIYVEKCPGTDDKCYSYWKYVEDDQNITSIAWIMRGCWAHAQDCDQSVCASSGRKVKDAYFCCCSGDFCNEKIDVLPTTSEAPTLLPNYDLDDNEQVMIIGLVIGGLCFVILVGCCAVAAFRCMKSKPLPHPSPVEDTPNSPCIDLDALNFKEIIGQGRYGTAYRAVVNNKEVAVKIFQQQHKSSFTNEKYIYSLPLMEHTNLLSYLGGGEYVNPEGVGCYALVLSYCPLGHLSSYLDEHTLDWFLFCRIALSATRGLSHLHSDIRKGDVVKPCISHRDFNTRNLLLTQNMTCIVSDLGFAIHTQGSKYYVNGEEHHAETASLTDVGTLRYMAPEVLEGAVNLRDCEAALRQIDIYALGLVLWECAARCHDLYQGLQPPPHMLPFQAEIGLHPTFEQMQVLVARNKARPLFPPVWKDTNPAIKDLKATLEDCWDHDAEARLSAMCVEGRLSELPMLWDRYKSSLGVNGVSPTINPMSQSIVSQRQGEMFSGLIGNGGKVISNALTPRDKESSVSESTVETIITNSPSFPPVEQVLGKNQLIGSLQPIIPSLQPHQGRNPCMERNLIREVPQEISISGNTLIDSLKENDVNSLNTINSVNFIDSLEVQQALEANGFVNEHLMPLLNGHSNTATAASQQRPTLPPPTLVPPIPYLQNEVRSIDNQPKRQNTAVRDENQESNLNAGRGSSWRRWKNTWEDRLKSLIPRRNQHNEEDEERQEILITPTSSSFSEPATPFTATQSVSVTSPHLPVQTEVLLSNGGPHTVISPNHMHNNTQRSALSNYIAETEIGIAKLHLQNGFAPVIRSRQGSKDSGLNKSSENSVSFVDSDNSCEKLKRPTTLSLLEKSHLALAKGNDNRKQQPKVLVDQDHGEKSQETEEESHIESDFVPETEASPPLRKAKQRVKTPRRPTNPRLSLYDDRIMGCSDSSQGSGGRGECKLEESLSHSLPIHMDTLDKHHHSHEKKLPFLSKSATRSIGTSKSASSASLGRHSKVASASNNDSQISNSYGSITRECYPPRHTQRPNVVRLTGDVL